MKERYLDMTGSNGCTALFLKDTRIIQAGTTVYSMPVSDRNEEYQRWAEAYDIHFIFDDRKVEVDFYVVPRLDILATDSRGGYLATVGTISDPDGSAPICYVNQKREVYLIADNFRALMERPEDWRAKGRRYEGIRFFRTKEEAQAKFPFLNAEKKRMSKPL